MEPAEAAEPALESSGPAVPAESAGLPDEAKPVEEITSKAESTLEAVAESALSVPEDKEKEEPRTEKSIVPSEPEARPDQPRAVSEEQPQDSTSVPEQGDDEWALPAKKKGKKKKGKKSVSLDAPEPAIEEKELEQHAAKETSPQPSIAEGGDDDSPRPVTGELTQEVADHDPTTKGEAAESQDLVTDVETPAEPVLQPDDAVVADTTAAEPADEPTPEAEPSAPLAGQPPQESPAPKPSESAEDPSPVEDVAATSTSKKDKKKKKGKKSTLLAESEAEKVGEQSSALDKGEGEATSVPANEEPVEQPVDVIKDMPEAKPDEPGPEVGSGLQDPPADKQQAGSETPAATDVQEAGPDEWALPSTKGKKGKKKRGKAISDATTPVSSRPMSPVLDEPAAPSDKPTEETVPTESSGEVEPGTLPESAEGTVGEADRSLQETSAETTATEDSKMGDTEPVREELDTTRGLSPVPAETSPKAEASLETPDETDQKTLETPGDDPSGALEDGADAEKDSESIPAIDAAEVEAAKLSTDLLPQDAQKPSASPEPPQMGAESVKPDEPEPIVEEWPSTKSKKKKGKKAKKGTSGATTPAVSRPESPAAEEGSTPPEDVAEQPTTASDPVAVSSEAENGDTLVSEPVPETVQPESAATAEIVEQQPEADEQDSVGKKKKGKKGKKKAAASSEATPEVSRPLSPVLFEPEPSVEGIKAPEPPMESTPAETDTEEGTAGLAGDDSRVFVPTEGGDNGHDDPLLHETSQPPAPVREEPPPQGDVGDADIWGPPTTKKKKKSKKGKDGADVAPEGAGLGLFRPASPARDDTLQSFRTGQQGETGDGTGELPADSGSRADTSGTRGFPAAADDGGAGGAEGQDAAEGEAAAIAQPLPAADKEASADLHPANRAEPVPIAAETEPAEGTSEEPTVSRQHSDDWGPASGKAKGRKGKKKGKHVRDVPGATVSSSAPADEDVHIPEESVEPDTAISSKPDLSVPDESGLEPPVPEEERHESNTSVAVEPSIEPDVQPTVQPEVSSETDPQVESSIQPEVSSAEEPRETVPGVKPPTREEVVEQSEATLSPQPEGESADLAAEPSTSRGPPEPEPEPVVEHETRIPTEDTADDGYDVPKKGKKGKKKGKSASTTPVASRPLTPADEDPLVPWSKSHEVSAPDIPAADAGVAKDGPAAPEQALDEWAVTPKKKKKAKKAKKPDETSRTTAPAVSRPTSPVQNEPGQDQRARAEPDEVATVQAGDSELPIAAPVEEGAEDWDFTSTAEGKKSEKQSQSAFLAASASRPTSPVIYEASEDQETRGEQPEPVQADLEPTVSIPAEEVEDWSFTASNKDKKDKKDKKRAPPSSDTTTPTASRAISPTRAVTETESSLPVPAEEQLAEDEWALPSSKKKGKKKGKKAKTGHDERLDRALPLPEERSMDATDEPPTILASDRSGAPEAAGESLLQSPQETQGSPSQEQEGHLTPAQASSHITHDAPSGEAARPEKKLKTEDAGSLMLSEPAMSVEEPFRETSTIEQPAETFETARDAGNAKEIPVEPEEQQQTRTLNKGKGVDTSSTRDMDDPLLQTSPSEDKTKTTVAAAVTAAGIAALADRSGGQTSKSKKKGKKKKIVDKRTEQEEDLFDDPLLWESPEKKTVMEKEDAGDEDAFWGGGDGEEARHEGLGLSEPMAGVEESRGVIGGEPAELVEGEREVEDATMPARAKETAVDVGRSAPDESRARGRLDETGPAAVEEWVSPEVEPNVPEWRTSRAGIQDVEEEARASEVEDRRSLEGGKKLRAETGATRGLARLEDTWEEPDESPILGRGEMREGKAIAGEAAPMPPVTPTRSLPSVDGSSRTTTTRSTLEESPLTPLRRSMSRNLEPVPEEEPETFGSPGQAKERRSRKPAARTDEINRDGGFATNSPRHSQRSQWQQEGAHRDSGVHLKDWAESPRQISPEPSSSRRKDMFKTPDGGSERRLKRSPRSARDLSDQEHHRSRTPVMRGPSPQAPTPEPQKSLRDHKTPDAPRSRYHDLGTPSLSAKRPSTPRLAQAAPSPAPRSGDGTDESPGPGQRSVSDNVSRPRHTPSPDVAPRRVASNTSLSLTRHRTPDPKLRPDTPGSIRSLHSATPPLRRAGRRISGDLRSISLSQRGQPEAEAEVPTSADSSDEHRSAQNSTPVANEGRVRAKDMTDVYVSLF